MNNYFVCDTGESFFMSATEMAMAFLFITEFVNIRRVNHWLETFENFMQTSKSTKMITIEQKKIKIILNNQKKKPISS